MPHGPNLVLDIFPHCQEQVVLLKSMSNYSNPHTDVYLISLPNTLGASKYTQKHTTFPPVSLETLKMAPV